MVNLPRGRIIGKLEHPVTGKPVDAAEAEHFMRADTPSAGVRRPVATRIVFRFLGRDADLRSAIAQTAILPVDSPSIEPRVRRLLAEPVDSITPRLP